jgi:transcriptional regulator with GAF, ATPase, and Fis domain
MFGHEKGAFTGAIHRRLGRFEMADGGTLFLDEVGDLPLEIQVRLLKVLQSKEFERVGGSETISSDFRLVAATNHDLEQDVKTDRFREDLFYRLNVFPIYVPPLRERREDIPLLVHYFLDKYASTLKKSFDTVLEKDLNRMLQYDWPGNVRELENIIQRAVIISHGSQLEIPKLGMLYKHTQVRTATTLKDNEMNHIQWALEKTRWKVSGSGGAAELLDIHPSTLEFRMKKHGIKRPQ